MNYLTYSKCEAWDLVCRTELAEEVAMVSLGRPASTTDPSLAPDPAPGRPPTAPPLGPAH